MKLIKLFSISIIAAFILALFSISTPAKAADFTTATISIPSIEVSAPIVPIYVRQFSDGSVTWDTSRLRKKVGFLDGTSWFGQPGNIVLGAHSEQSRGVADVFYKLDQIQVGAEIIATVDGIEMRYAVVNVYTVGYEDISPLYPTGHEQLTLITCDLGSYTGSTGSYSHRIVVVAHRIG